MRRWRQKVHRQERLPGVDRKRVTEDTSGRRQPSCFSICATGVPARPCRPDPVAWKKGQSHSGMQKDGLQSLHTLRLNTWLSHTHNLHINKQQVHWNVLAKILMQVLNLADQQKPYPLVSLQNVGGGRESRAGRLN